MENKTKILVLGAGAIGSNLCANLAIDLKDKAEITVLDFDKVEPRNWQAGTQFYRSEQRGKYKVEALTFNIYKWLGIGLNPFNIQISRNNIGLLGDFSLIIDAFDNFESRKLVYGYCKQGKTDCLHVGFSPQMTFEIMWNENYTPPTDYAEDTFDVCEANGARSFVHLVSAMASLVVQEYIKNGEKKAFVGNRFNLTEIL